MSKRSFLTEISKSLASLVSFQGFVKTAFPAQKRVVTIAHLASPTVKREYQPVLSTPWFKAGLSINVTNLTMVQGLRDCSTLLTLLPTMGPGPAFLPFLTLISLFSHEQR